MQYEYNKTIVFVQRLMMIYDLKFIQVDGGFEGSTLSKSTLHWILLYRLILHEETISEKAACDQLDTSTSSNTSSRGGVPLPGSVNFLCSAHDYLGQLGLCTADGGEMLTVLVDRSVECLFKNLSSRSAEDQVYIFLADNLSPNHLLLRTGLFFRCHTVNKNIYTYFLKFR